MYLAIHKHSMGVSVTPFQSLGTVDAEDYFDALPNPLFGDDEGNGPSRVDFARALGIDYEPELDEELEIVFCDITTAKTLDISKLIAGESA